MPRKFGIGSGSAVTGGTVSDEPASRDASLSPQLLQSIFFPVERSPLAQALIDVGAALAWMFLGMVALLGVGICIGVPIFLAFG